MRSTVKGRIGAAFGWLLASLALVPAARAELEPESLIQGPAERMGKWETVYPANYPENEPPGANGKASLGMQSVHTVLLPSGKVLMVNGSSLRDLAPSERFPDGKGVLDRENVPKLTWEEVDMLTDSTGLYDPTFNFFEKIASPRLAERLRQPPSGPNPHSLIADLFCSGHLHLPDGNVLFVGGTQFYTPYTGGRTAHIFDWREEAWVDAGLTRDGHWYPSLVPLADGRIVTLSGLSIGLVEVDPSSSFAPGVPWVSPIVEIFDPERFDRDDPQRAWTHLDVREVPNNPWSRPLWPESVRNDTFVLYPRAYALADGRIFLGHEGSIQMTSEGSGGPANSRNTYFLEFDPRPRAGEPPTVSFSHGPDKPHVYRHYGGSVADPTTGDLLYIGGQQGPEHGYDGWNWHASQRGIQAQADLSVFRLPDAEHPDGRWEEFENFLGDRPTDGRLNHLAVVLPTQQVLVVNGGYYSLARPNFTPLLLSPDASRPAGYRVEPMNEATQPRLYHNSALLLPDARVLTAGGNNPRAVVDLETGEVTMPEPEGTFAIPQEIWEAEIWSPPYLFLPGTRAEIRSVKELASVSWGGEYLEPGASVALPGKGDDRLRAGRPYMLEIDALDAFCAPGDGTLVLIKLPSVTHGWDGGQRLVELEHETYLSVPYPEDAPDPLSYPTIVFKAPAIGPTLPPAYYMLFYVDCRGKPSVARIVRLAA